MVKSKKIVVVRYLNSIILIKKNLQYDFFEYEEIESIIGPIILNHVIDRKVKQDCLEYYWSYTISDFELLLKLKNYPDVIFINNNNLYKYNLSSKVKNTLKKMHI